MKALVTGANGFLGSWVVRGLLKRGFNVSVIHRPNSDISALKDLDVQAHIGDITDLESLVRSFKNIDCVFHVAGLVSYNQFDREKMEKVNVQGTANVLKACETNSVKRMVHTSSVVTIGASREKKVLDETATYNLKKYDLGYFETKKKAEELVLDAAEKGSVNAVIVNPSSMFGPGDAVKSSRKKYLRVAQGNFPYYTPGGVNILDVEDAVEGHILALEKGRAGQRYILGAENITVKQLFELFAKAGGNPPPKKKLPRLVLEAMFYSGKLLRDLHSPFQFSYESAMIGSLYHWYDHSKAQNELGFNPRPAAQAINRSVEWSFKNGLLKKS